jgi:hypothetical protein
MHIARTPNVPRNVYLLIGVRISPKPKAFPQYLYLFWCSSLTCTLHTALDTHIPCMQTPDRSVRLLVKEGRLLY